MSLHIMFDCSPVNSKIATWPQCKSVYSPVKITYLSLEHRYIINISTRKRKGPKAARQWMQVMYEDADSFECRVKYWSKQFKWDTKPPVGVDPALKGWRNWLLWKSARNVMEGRKSKVSMIVRERGVSEPHMLANLHNDLYMSKVIWLSSNNDDSSSEPDQVSVFRRQFWTSWSGWKEWWNLNLSVKSWNKRKPCNINIVVHPLTRNFGHRCCLEGSVAQCIRIWKEFCP
jgi:hypothetical protein